MAPHKFALFYVAIPNGVAVNQQDTVQVGGVCRIVPLQVGVWSVRCRFVSVRCRGQQTMTYL